MPKNPTADEHARRVDRSKRFGHWVRAVRKDAGMDTVDDAAARAGVSRDTWTVIELGGRTFNRMWRPLLPAEPEKLEMIAKVLGVPADEVYRRAGQVMPGDPFAPFGESPQALTDALSQLARLAEEVPRLMDELRATREENAGLRERVDPGSAEGVPRRRRKSAPPQPG